MEKEREKEGGEKLCLYFGSLNVKFSWICNLDISHIVRVFCCYCFFLLLTLFITEGKKDKGSLRTDPGLFFFSLSGNFKNRTFFNSLTKLCKYKVKVTKDRTLQNEVGNSCMWYLFGKTLKYMWTNS